MAIPGLSSLVSNLTDFVCFVLVLSKDNPGQNAQQCKVLSATLDITIQPSFHTEN
jgi:hypothetical protein